MIEDAAGLAIRAGVVDEDVDPFDRRDHVGRDNCVGHVELDGRPLDVGRNSLGTLEVDVRDRDPSAGGRQHACDPLPDARRTAGDHGDPAIER